MSEFTYCNREFPSLSNAPQTQNQNPGQAIWANANQRAIQPSAEQRPQQHGLRQALPQHQQTQNNHGSHITHQTAADIFPHNSQFSGRFDDYRHGGQGGVGQLAGSGQPQPGSIEEFPPLGSGAPDDGGLDRRGSLIRNAAFDGFPTNSYHGASNTASQQIGSGMNNMSAEGRRSSNLVDQVLSPHTRPFGVNLSQPTSEGGRPPNEPTADSEKDGIPATRNTSHSSNTLFSNFHDSSLPSQQNLPPIQQPSRTQPASQAGFRLQTSADALDQPSPQNAEMDKWGLGSLLAIMKGENPDATGLAVGQDLTQLGLNLNSPE